MPVISTPAPVKFPLQLIFFSGLLVGTLDILSAFTDYYIASGKNPLLVLLYVASGAIGKSALSGGAGTMLMGLLFHYFIAFTFTILFFWLYARTSLLHGNWIITGIGYGIFIWLIMNLIVVQLSGAPHAPIAALKAGKIAKSALILICMIGLPLSFIARKYKPNIFLEKDSNDLQTLSS